MFGNSLDLSQFPKMSSHFNKNNISIELTKAFDVALTIQFIELFGKTLIDIAQKMHSLILERTIMGLESSFQFISFTNFVFMVCIHLIQLNKTFNMAQAI